MASLKTSLKTHILNKLIDDFAADSKSSSFLFIARPEVWSSESEPPTYVDSAGSFNDAWNRMIGAKRISSADAFLMIPKNSWVSGTTYGMYTSNDDTTGITFYTTNAENNVYKCIFNGASGGNTTSSIQSTVQPRGTSPNVITTGDGYKWKFMFKIPENYNRFKLDDYVPIKNLKIEDGVPEKYTDDRFLQYSVQYNATGGAIDYIDISNSGSSYGYNVPSRTSGDSTLRTFVISASNTGTTGTAVLNSNESSTDDYYNTYALNITKGTGVGQSRRISDYIGSSRTIVVNSNWTTIPDTTSVYEIMPEVIIDGDGTGAQALAIISDGITLEGVKVIDSGSDYTRATVTIKSTNNGNGATLEPIFSPYGGHGYNPVSELNPTRLMVLARLDREDSAITGDSITAGSFPIVNDFRQYGLMKNPILATGPSKGEIAGIDVDTITSVNISAATGSIFNFSDFVENDIVFGENSQSCGKVLNWYRSTDISKGTLRLLNVNSNFEVGEPVSALGTGSVWSSSGKPTGYVQFQDESQITQTNSSYRLTTYLEIQTTAGNSSDNYSSSNFDLDQVIQGASGSSATIVEYIPSGGKTAALYLTSIAGISSADQHGFTVGENLSGVTISSVINKLEPSEFIKGSGELLHISNITSVSRHNEQEEEIKIIIDI